MNKEHFDKMIEGLINPSRIKVLVIEDYNVLLSARNTNDTMTWFKENGDILEKNLRGLGLRWVYVIETCPDDKPYIYMFIGPNMTKSIADKLTDRAKRTLPDDRTMIVSEGYMRYVDIDKYDNTPTTILEELLKSKSIDVFKVSEI